MQNVWSNPIAVLCCSQGKGIRAFLIASVLCLGQVTLSRQGDAVAGDIVSVPIRWCALKGSPAVTDPQIDGQRFFPDGRRITTDDVLWNRHERISDHVYIDNEALPEADDPRITFRSAFTREIRDSPTQNFPVLEDLDLDAAGNPIPGTMGPGEEGDILEPNEDVDTPKEFLRRLLACDKRWSEITDINGDPIKIDWGKGITALNVKGTSHLNGTKASSFRGFGWTSETGLPHPFVVVTDISSAGASARFDTLLVHETAHALGESHLTQEETMELGGGAAAAVKRNPMCDGQFTDPPHTCDAPNQILLTREQAGRMRTFAQGIGNLDPPATILPGPLVADVKTDALEDALSFIDLAEFKIQEDTSTGITAFTHILAGLIPPQASNLSYWTLVDLDNTPSTGGQEAAIAALGVPPTAFIGVELVTRVQAMGGDGGQPMTATLWTFDAGLGAFTTVSDPSIEASKDTIALFDGIPPEVSTQFAGDPLPLLDVISIRFASRIRGPIPCPFRIHAISEASIATAQAVDELDQPSPGAGFAACLTPQTNFPTCEIHPGTARAGASAAVAVEGLIPDSPAHVVFGEIPVGAGDTDASGKALIPFVTPRGAREGLHLVTVGSDGTALTADCFMRIEVPHKSICLAECKADFRSCVEEAPTSSILKKDEALAICLGEVKKCVGRCR